MTLNGEETKTVQDALGLLQSLQPQLRHLLEERKSVKVKLETLDVLKAARRGEEVEAHVLYLGVNGDDEETERLKRVCGKEFDACCLAGSYMLTG
jgi:hypothetical protein